MWAVVLEAKAGAAPGGAACFMEGWLCILYVRQYCDLFKVVPVPDLQEVPVFFGVRTVYVGSAKNFKVLVRIKVAVDLFKVI